MVENRLITNHRTIYQGYDVWSEDNGDGTQTLHIDDINEGYISVLNIQVYKYQDLAAIEQEGGELANDREYADAEITLQVLYNQIMNGGEQ